LLLSGAPKDSLNCLDLFLLLSAIIWHDVGMVATRSNHAAAATSFISRVRESFFPELPFYRLVSLMTRAHSGNEGWASLQSSEEVAACTHNTCTIYPQSLAAMLRFADEISETRTRISPVLLKDVPDANRLYWEYANCITASKPEPVRNRILLSLEVQVQSALARYSCPTELSSRADQQGKISLIEYIICRLEKMNNERVYCFPYLTRYANIRSIEVRLQICQDADCQIFDDIVIGDGGLADAGYPNVQFFDHFLEKYPALTPASLNERSAK
jgi:hypothetical protein